MIAVNIKLLAGCLVFFSVYLLISCSGPGVDDRIGNVFRYNEAANITSLDPAYARDQSVIWPVNQVFNGLVQMDDNLEIIPCIADSWEIRTNGLEYRFHLRNDVYFHNDPVFHSRNGKIVRAGDFIYSFKRILDPATASSGAWIFDYVAQSDSVPAFIAPDDSTLVIMLKKPFPPFLSMLAMPYASVVPEEAVKRYGDGFRRHPVGTGPFMFKYWKEGVKLVLIKNPAYFETDGNNRLPFLDAVSISFLSDKQSAFLEFVTGRLDFLSGLDPSYKDELLTKQGRLQQKYKSTIDVLTQPYLNTEYLGFLMDQETVDGKPNPLRDKRVRQAINLAFDRNKMITYLRNNIGSPGINGIIPKGLPSFDSSKIYYTYDIEKARRLLSEAGFPGGKGMPSVTLVSTPDYLDFCKHIQQQLAELGVDMKIEISTPAAIKQMKSEARLPFFRASWIADYPDAENYLLMFLSQNFCPRGPNYTHFTGSNFDSLYDLAMHQVNDSIRYGIYRHMEQLVMDESPVVVLYYDQVLRFVRKGITGLGSNPMNMLTLKRVKINHR
ncbi:MAG: ABC transporter substrate-binding protein [Bacteroidetes bacterium]|nr:ABC transporter substrate-binding protein [Bacteroidota bacterium]